MLRRGKHGGLDRADKCFHYFYDGERVAGWNVSFKVWAEVFGTTDDNGLQVTVCHCYTSQGQAGISDTFCKDLGMSLQNFMSGPKPWDPPPGPAKPPRRG